MHKFLLIGLAGFLGTLARYGISGWVARHMGETYPTGTLAVNLIGCFFVGSLFYLFGERFLVDPVLRSSILIGFLGGFTTFSSFGLQTFTLIREGEMGLAVMNILLSNAGGLFMVWAGYTLSRLFGGGGL